MREMKWKEYIMPNLPYAFLFWLAAETVPEAGKRQTVREALTFRKQ